MIMEGTKLLGGTMAMSSTGNGLNEMLLHRDALTLQPALVNTLLTSEADLLTLSVRHSMMNPVPPKPYAS